MTRTLCVAAMLSLGVFLAPTTRADQPSAAPSPHADCPMHQDHDGHLEGVNTRGDHAMGFDHEKTTHHFVLMEDGGSIEVTANEAKDDASRDRIRQHLGHIAKMFSDGNFEIPMLIHAQTPPGAAVMKQKKDDIRYRYEDVERGGRLRISTNDAGALAAIHDFLRFQIKDHRTGDPLEAVKNR